MLKRKLACLMGAMPIFAGGVAYAQTDKAADSFRVSAQLDTRHVENANHQPSSEDAESEVQTEASVLMLGHLRGRLVDFRTDYAFNSRHYSEFSERDEQLLLGASNLVVGPAHRRQYLEFSHSSREILLDPTISDLPENRDSRTILTAAAFTSMRIGQPNTLSLQVSASDFDFKEATENEAKQISFETNFKRLVSPLYQIGLSVAGYNLEYRESGDDLTYGEVTLLWTGALRHAEYSAEIGHSSMEFVDETLESPLIRLQWAYEAAGQRFSLSAARKLSDTSQGSGNQGEFGASVGVDGRVNVIDQFKLSEFAFHWRHDNPCDRCNFDIGIELQEESYNNFPEYSSREANLIFKAGYLLNRAVGIEFSSLIGRFSAYRVDNANDYSHTQASLAAVFPSLVRDGALAVFIGADERDFEISDGYTSAYIGARFQYLLLNR